MGLMANPDPRGERNNRMPAKRRSAQVSGPGCRGTRVIWRKLDCLNPNLQMMQRLVRRKDIRDRRHALRRHGSAAVATFGAGSVAQRGQFKEMSGTPTSRSDVRQGRTWDQPLGCEAQGDGVLVVVVEQRPTREDGKAVHRAKEHR